MAIAEPLPEHVWATIIINITLCILGGGSIICVVICYGNNITSELMINNEMK